jgi:two-component system NtrC family sensor kinase
LTLLNNSIDKSKITIIKEYDADIKPIECYPGKINQVFMNILHNAIQAMNEKKGGEEKNITIKTYKNDRDLFISIKDNGVGIPEKIKNKIFDPFFTTKQVGEGTGLGLSIAHSIIKSHNGEIQIKSEEGKGTEFIIILPLSQSHKN